MQKLFILAAAYYLQTCCFWVKTCKLICWYPGWGPGVISVQLLPCYWQYVHLQRPRQKYSQDRAELWLKETSKNVFFFGQLKIFHQPDTKEVVQKCNTYVLPYTFPAKLANFQTHLFLERAIIFKRQYSLTCCRQLQQVQGKAQKQYWVLNLHDRDAVEHLNNYSSAILENLLLLHSHKFTTIENGMTS